MADPWWLPGCKNNIAKIPGAKMCSDQHCTDAQNQGHMVCYCCDPFQNGCSGQQAPANCGDPWPTKLLLYGGKPLHRVPALRQLLLLLRLPGL